MAALQTSLLCWFLFLPAAYPWYAIGVLALSALRPRPWAIVLSGAFGLYYLLFLYGYRNYGPAWKLATQAMEHGLVWVALIVGFLVNRANRGPAQDPTW
ncbi:MAG: hypothetical protein GY851_19055 [bacterium]|nr:hypothetical protein [bacterium]